MAKIDSRRNKIVKEVLLAVPDDLDCELTSAAGEDGMWVITDAGGCVRGAMRALCEIYRELDHDADIHRADIAAHGKLTVPVLASGGGAQTLAANYAPMCEEIANDVTGHLVPATPGIGSPRRTLTTSVACSSTSTPQPEPDSRAGRTIDTPSLF